MTDQLRAQLAETIGSPPKVNRQVLEGVCRLIAEQEPDLREDLIAYAAELLRPGDELRQRAMADALAGKVRQECTRTRPPVRGLVISLDGTVPDPQGDGPAA